MKRVLIVFTLLTMGMGLQVLAQNDTITTDERQVLSRNDMIRFAQWTGHTTVFPIPQDMLLIHNDWKQNEGY